MAKALSLETRPVWWATLFVIPVLFLLQDPSFCVRLLLCQPVHVVIDDTRAVAVRDL